MNLQEFAIFFRKKSGRFDMVNADGSDRGLFLIMVKQAQRMLDQFSPTTQQVKSRLRDIGAGDFLQDIPGIRRIDEVYITDTEGKTELTERSYKHLRSDFPQADWGAMERSRPVYWGRLTSRLPGDQSDLGAGELPSQATYDTEDVIFETDGVAGQSIEDTRGIILLPPADHVYTVRVVGTFWTMELREPTDSNFWSDANPQLLYQALMYFLEIDHRNSEGQQDMLRAIRIAVEELDKDTLEVDFTRSAKMKG